MDTPAPSCLRRTYLGGIGALLLAVLVAAGGCDLLNPSEPDPTVSLSLSGVPDDAIEEARVKIEAVYLEGEDSSHRETLLHEPTEMIELQTLREDPVELLDEKRVPPGSYTRVRVVLGKAEIQTEEGRYSAEYLSDSDSQNSSLRCPTCPETGVEVLLPRPGLTLDPETRPHARIVVDFDVSQSFERKSDQPERGVLKPVLTAAIAEVSGTIDGRVHLADETTLPESCGEARPSIQDFAPLLRTAETGEILKSAAVDANGQFTIDHISPTVHHLSYADSVDVENSGRMLIFEASVQPKKPYIRNGEAARVEIEVTNAQCSESR